MTNPSLTSFHYSIHGLCACPSLVSIYCSPLSEVRGSCTKRHGIRSLFVRNFIFEGIYGSVRSAKKFPRSLNTSGHVPRKHPPLIVNMSYFEYPITHPVALNRWAIVFIIVGALAWSILITLISVAAVGYELIPLSSTDYNATYSIWYEKFIPHGSGLIPQTWECNASIIKLNEGCPILTY